MALASAPAVIDTQYTLAGLATLNRLVGRYEATDSAVDRLRIRRSGDKLSRLVWFVLNNQAAGKRSRAVGFADSLRATGTRLLRENSATDVFGNLADVIPRWASPRRCWATRTWGSPKGSARWRSIPRAGMPLSHRAASMA